MEGPTPPPAVCIVLAVSVGEQGVPASKEVFTLPADQDDARVTRYRVTRQEAGNA